MIEQVGGFFVETDPGPVWSREMLMRTAVMNEEQIPVSLDADRFHAVSYKQLLWHLHALVDNSLNLRTIASFFEFGCGSARLIRHMRSIEGLRLMGSDAIPDSIEWCTENVPGIRFEVNTYDPPLTFAKDDSFDVLIAHSVFTHIPLATQDRMDRRAQSRPATRRIRIVHSARAHARRNDARRTQAPPACRDRLTRAHWFGPEASTSTKVTNTWDVFQTRAETIEAFRKRFIIRDYRHGGQDLLILQKPS